MTIMKFDTDGEDWDAFDYITLTNYIDRIFCDKVFDKHGFAIFSKVILVDTHVQIYLCTATDNSDYGLDLIGEMRSIFENKFGKESSYKAITVENAYR